MSDSRSLQVEEEQSDKDIDFDSFVEAERQMMDKSSGKARLRKCNLITNAENLPDGYRDEYNSFSFDQYLVFKSEDTGSGESKKVVIPVDSHEFEFVKSWTESESVSSLAGSTVPIRHINENTYRIKNLKREFFSPLIPASKLRKAERSGYIEYDNELWVLNSELLLKLRLTILSVLVFTFTYVAIFTSFTLVGISLLFIVVLAMIGDLKSLDAN